MESNHTGTGGVHKTSMCLRVTILLKSTISLPTTALIVCIGLSLVSDFEKSTETHCKVANYLPSISASIGSFPQKFIWQIFIALHTTPRIFITLFTKQFYLNFVSSTQNSSRYKLIYVIVVVEVVEVLSLLFLTIVSSTEAYEWHERSFITFVLSSQLNMLLKIAVFSSLKQDPDFSLAMARSLSAKVKLWLLNVISIILAGYFFLRHNNYCEPGMYTLFALCEYIMVLSNISFHATSLFEFSDTDAVIEICSYGKKKP